MRLVWTASARQELREAIRYIAEDSPSAARHLLNCIRESAGLLCDMPNMGRLGRVEGTRELVVTATPFVLAYRVGVDAVTVLHMFHGARRWPSEM